MPAEAVDIARVQRRAWNRDPVTAQVLQEIPADEMARSWHEAIVKPPLAHFRVLVALGDGQVVGFTAIGPSPDEDADVTDGHIAEFVVGDDDEEHSGRLLNAAIDTLRKDGYEMATIWLPSHADAFRKFLESSGWGPDGAHREVGTDDESVRLKLIRLHTDIRSSEES